MAWPASDRRVRLSSPVSGSCREAQQTVVPGVALVVDADDALGAHRPDAGTGEPAAVSSIRATVRRSRSHAVFNPVGVPAAPCVGDASQRSREELAVRLDQLGKLPHPWRQRGGISEKTEWPVAPGDDVGADIPDEGRPGRSRPGWSRLFGKSGCHGRLVSGHCGVILISRICLSRHRPRLSFINISANHGRTRSRGTRRRKPVACDGEDCRGTDVPKVDSQPDSNYEADTSRQNRRWMDGALAGEKTACFALVPVVRRSMVAGADQRMSPRFLSTSDRDTPSTFRKPRSIRAATPPTPRPLRGAVWHKARPQAAGGRSRQMSRSLINRKFMRGGFRRGGVPSPAAIPAMDLGRGCRWRNLGWT